MRSTPFAHPLRDAAAIAIVLFARCASAGDLQETRTFDIRAQALDTALVQFSKQADFQVVTNSATVALLKTRGVQGRLAVHEALARLLDGSGLTYRVIGRDVIAIDGDKPKDGAPNAPSSSAEAPTTLAQAAVDAAPAAEPAPKAEGAQSVTVTGSRLLRVDVEGPMPVKTIRADEIARSGQATLGQLLNTLPEVSVGFTESINEGQYGAATVQLHGLPAGTTLVLLNGRRVEAGGSSLGKFFDLNSIPVGAIERIEILPVGSSAIYGSDALAGVVNIILKRDLRGIEATLRHGAASGLSETGVDLAWGRTWERASVSIIASALRRKGLSFSERAITGDNDYRRFGGPDLRRPICNPGTIYSSDGANLPGLDAPFAAIPPGLTGRPTRDDFVATAGQENLCSYFGNYWAIPDSERVGALLNFHVDLTPRIKLFGEFAASRVKQTPGAGPQVIFGTVGADNPYNPFGVPLDTIYIFPRSSPLQRTGSAPTVFTRPVLGLSGALGETWSWEVAAWQARDKTSANFPTGVADPAAIDAAFSSSDPATAFNPFVPGDPVSREIQARLFLPLRYTFSSQANVVNAFVRGPALELPAGSLDVVVGAETARSSLRYSESRINAPGDFRREESAVFAEARVPLMKRAADGGELLAASLAVRHNRSDDFGSNTTPQAGLEWRPARSLLLRASVAQAYRAPSLESLFKPEAPPCDGCLEVTDPKRGNETVLATYLASGNPNLKAETGRSKALGLAWDSQRIPGLQTTLTLWEVSQNNRVTTLTSQDTVDHEDAFPGRVVRAPGTPQQPGEIVAVRIAPVNFGTLKVAGVDVNTSYRIQSALGEFTPGLALTRTLKYRAALLPNTAPESRLDRADTDGWAPRVKSMVSLQWKRGAASAQLAARHVGRYTDYDGARLLGPITFVDASIGYDAKSIASQVGAKSLHWRLGVVNLFDKLPEYSNNDYGYGYDPSQGDIRGRFIFTSLSAKW